MATAQITPQKLRVLIHTAVREELQEFLSDPDFGLHIRETVIKRLHRSMRSRKAGRLASAGDIIARLRLNP